MELVDQKDRGPLSGLAQGLSRQRCGFLASVRTLEEAQIVLECSVDIIDLKDPGRGALGGLERDAVRAIVHHVAGRVSVSATIGDFVEMNPEDVCVAVERMADTGVDIVKVGLHPVPHLTRCIEALARLAIQKPIVAVLFAEHQIAPGLLTRLAAAHFFGAMIDTFDKAAGSLRLRRSDQELFDFVEQAQALGLVTGLAGSLQESDVLPLLALGPDYLGFRGALCDGAQRTGHLARERVAAVGGLVATRPQRDAGRLYPPLDALAT
ncbi:MAG: (5-formylfuran-3-yl)methyl phosphate synthase [Burkholderiaceae bacterium]|jgi:dihydroneopterin aldolase